VYIEYKNRNLYYYTYDEFGDRSPISAADAEKLLEESGFTLQAAKKIAIEYFERKVKK